MSRHTISLIAAMDRNRVIGLDGKLPWHLPADLQWFKRCTMGKPILMGRHTWNSIGRPLPGRRNIVLTSDQDFSAEGATVVHSLEEALEAAGDAEEVMVIGGGVLFSETIAIANRLYLTVVDGEFAGDTWFPFFASDDWEETFSETHEPDENNAFRYTFLIWEHAGN
ncbi:MAG: type 3 dihydrofolate reductase [Halofilum sp. (in: g-proteobacteria)]|nr:type 3 dihydrofolate reductase [Halofilum sp. (in: g-proteobacteria)]